VRAIVPASRPPHTRLTPASHPRHAPDYPTVDAKCALWGDKSIGAEPRTGGPSGGARVDRNSPAHATPFQRQWVGGRAAACALASAPEVWSTWSSGWVVGVGTRSGPPGAEIVPCREYDAAGAPPSRQADPVGLAPVPPSALPHRSRAPAGLTPTRSVRYLPSSTQRSWT